MAYSLAEVASALDIEALTLAGLDRMTEDFGFANPPPSGA